MAMVLTRSDVFACLDTRSCIVSVENALCREAAGQTLAAGVLATHAAEGGFHVKVAGLLGERAYYAAKVNANFPSNPIRNGLPTIQGVISLHDADTGAVLALIDSPSITALRTAAATAIAAKSLARADAATVALAGCGVQAPSQLRALGAVRRIERVRAYDSDRSASERLADAMRAELGCDVAAVASFEAAAADADIIVTCTPARRPILSAADVRAGSFVAAVGADSPEKQELDPALVASSTLVVDALEQCASFGELHHALQAGSMSRDDVHATLADVVAGRRVGRARDSEITIFDSTGTGLEDAAAAAAAYECAVSRGVGALVSLDA
jgi:ornithine cyclodeaminase/alanine dehydrogenase-like protein (mu-crystallin family)